MNINVYVVNVAVLEGRIVSDTLVRKDTHSIPTLLIRIRHLPRYLCVRIQGTK
jgi:hypothetical protein